MMCARCHQPITKGALFLRVLQATDIPHTEAYTENPLAAHLVCPEPPKAEAPELSARQRIAQQAWQAKK